MITFQNRRVTKKVEAKSAEPLQLKSCYALQAKSNDFNGPKQEKVKQTELLLEIANVDIRLCDIAFHSHFKTTDSLLIRNENDAKLLEKVLKN